MCVLVPKCYKWDMATLSGTTLAVKDLTDRLCQLLDVLIQTRVIISSEISHYCMMMTLVWVETSNTIDKFQILC